LFEVYDGKTLSVRICSSCSLDFVSHPACGHPLSWGEGKICRLSLPEKAGVREKQAGQF
jgi:hypothetical protein